MSSRIVRLSLILGIAFAAAALAAPGPVVEDARLWLGRPGPGSLRIPAQPAFERALAEAFNLVHRTTLRGDRMKFTRRQGEYLAFLHLYRLLHGRSPAESEIADFFSVSAPSAHQMVVTLDRKGLIHRIPGAARSITVLVDPRLLPSLRGHPTSDNPSPTPETGSVEEAVVTVSCRIVDKLYESNEIYALDDREFVPLLGRVLQGVEEGLDRLGLGPQACERSRERVRDHAENLYVELCAKHDPRGADREEDARAFQHLMLFGRFPAPI